MSACSHIYVNLPSILPALTLTLKMPQTPPIPRDCCRMKKCAVIGKRKGRAFVDPGFRDRQRSWVSFRNLLPLPLMPCSSLPILVFSIRSTYEGTGTETRRHRRTEVRAYVGAPQPAIPFRAEVPGLEDHSMTRFSQLKN